MLLNELKLVQRFCEIDDFTRVYEQKPAGHLLPATLNSKHSSNKPAISRSEMMSVEILYPLSGHQCFEYFSMCVHEVLNGSLKRYFAHAPCYNGFVELKPGMLVALICYLHCIRPGTLSGLYYADSTALKVCHTRRIHCHTVFISSAKTGQCSVGWFYGFKLFLVVNGWGEIVQAFVTPGKVSDCATSTLQRLFKGLTELAFADKGFVNQKAFALLYEPGLKLITYIRSNMKNKPVGLREKMLLKKTGMIESVIDMLKRVCNTGHTRQRSTLNMIVNT
jgi:hypothetical protein